MRDYSSDDVETREPASPPARPSRRSRMGEDDADPRGQGSPQVLARIPSLAAEESDYDDPEPQASREGRVLGSRISLKILALAGAVIFGAALWGFVFDKNRDSKDAKDKDTASATTPAKEPFKPEVPAPNAPAAPRWSGTAADSANWQAGTPTPPSPDSGNLQPGAPNRPAADRWSNPAVAGAANSAMQAPAMGGGPQARGTNPPSSQAPPGMDPASAWSNPAYPNTANRSAPPSWDAAPGRDGSGEAPSVARRDPPRPDMPTSANRPASYNEARDAYRDNPAAFSYPNTAAPAGNIQGGLRPGDAGQPAPTGTRSLSLGERRPIEAPDARQPLGSNYRSDYGSDYRADYRPDHRMTPGPDARVANREGARTGYDSGMSPAGYPTTSQSPEGVMPTEQRMPAPNFNLPATRNPSNPAPQQPAGGFPAGPAYPGPSGNFQAPAAGGYPGSAAGPSYPQAVPGYPATPPRSSYPSSAGMGAPSGYPAAGTGYPAPAAGGAAAADYSAPPTAMRPSADPYAPSADPAARFNGTIARPDVQAPSYDRPRTGLY